MKPDLLNDPAAYIVVIRGFNAKHEMIPAWPIFATEKHKHTHKCTVKPFRKLIEYIYVYYMSL